MMEWVEAYYCMYLRAINGQCGVAGVTVQVIGVGKIRGSNTRRERYEI